IKPKVRVPLFPSIKVIVWGRTGRRNQNPKRIITVRVEDAPRRIHEQSDVAVAIVPVILGRASDALADQSQAVGVGLSYRWAEADGAEFFNHLRVAGRGLIVDEEIGCWGSCSGDGFADAVSVTIVLEVDSCWLRVDGRVPLRQPILEIVFVVLSLRRSHAAAQSVPIAVVAVSERVG